MADSPRPESWAVKGPPASPASFSITRALDSIRVGNRNSHDWLVSLERERQISHIMLGDVLGVIKLCQPIVVQLLLHVEAMQEAGHVDIDHERFGSLDKHPLAQEIIPRLFDLAKLLDVEVPGK
jgi:hypothetical protein